MPPATLSRSQFRILPVIDLQAGIVVHGVGGHRDRYAPIRSRLTDDHTPGSVAEALVQHFSASEIYVADLDAIGGASCDWESLDAIAASGMRVWLDCGISSPESAQAVADAARQRDYLAALIVGLESIREAAELSEICTVIEQHRAVFSLDLQSGCPLTRVPELACLQPQELAELACRAGFQRMIVLDLTFVGSSQGVGVGELCRQIRLLAPSLQIFAGGGIRKTADMQLLAEAGCNGVLVASALHNGDLVPSQLVDFLL